MKKIKILTIFFAIIGIISSVLLLAFVIDDNLNKNNSPGIMSMSFSSPENTSYFDCENLSLESTANCLQRYVESIYNYTITDDNLNLSLEDLKKYGGDCKDWSELYNKMAKDLGFESKTFTFYTDTYGHMIAFIIDETGYCMLDQTIKPKCLELIVKENGEKGVY